MSRRLHRKRKSKHTTKTMYRDEWYGLEEDSITILSYRLHSKRVSIKLPYNNLYLSIRYMKSRLLEKGE